jgi:hypothetical protein
MKTYLTLIAVFILYSFTNAQNCQGENIKVYSGATGCGCHCQEKCVTPAELPFYLANGWNTEGCWNCCKFFHGGWVDNEPSGISLDTLYPAAEPGSMTLAFTLASECKVKIEVVDLTGRSVTTVVERFIEDQENELTWDNSDIPSGMYFLTMTAGVYNETKLVSIIN